jgi:hypothetical protein
MSNDYADLVVNSIEINKDYTTFTTKEGVTKQYVDTTVDSRISSLINGAPAVLDTLKELSDALASDPNFATTVASSVAVVQTNVNTLSSQVSSLASENKSALDAEVLARQQLSTSTDSRFVASNALIAQNTASITSNYNTELAARTAADTALEQKIASEKAISAAAVAQEATSRAAADTALEQKIASEKAVSAAAVAQEAISRTAADTALENKIADEKKVSAAAVAQEATVRLSGDDALNSKIDSVVSQVNANLSTKLAVSDNYSKRLDGNFGVSEDSFLYIGDLWRIRANNSAGGPKKMQFEYSDDNGVTFKLGVPFIRTPAVSSAPYLVTPTLTSTPNPNFLISSNSELDPALYPARALFDGNQAGYYASGGVFSNIAPYLATSAVTFNTGSSIINGPYVKITLNEEKRFNYYRLGQTSSALAAYSIAGFTLYGSNDNVSYTLLNQQTNYNLVGTIGVWNPKIVLGEQQYRYIVIHMNRLAGSGTVADVMNMEIGYE